MKSLTLAAAALGLLLASAAIAAEPGYLGIQVTNGTADLYSTSGHYLSAYEHSEIGVGLSYWRLMSKDYAFAFDAGLGGFQEKDQSSLAGQGDSKYSQSSYRVRIGGDRAVKVGDRAILYFGPGIEFWQGKAKFEGPEFPAFESKAVNRFAFSGRIGGVMMLSPAAGLNVSVGRYYGLASVSDGGAKSSWWPSGFHASCGVLFKI